MDWDTDDFRAETAGYEDTSQASSLDRNGLSNSLQSLSDSLPCGTIATVSVTKHIVQATGKEVWTVDKVSSIVRSDEHDIPLADMAANAISTAAMRTRNKRAAGTVLDHEVSTHRTSRKPGMSVLKRQ